MNANEYRCLLVGLSLMLTGCGRRGESPVTLTRDPVQTTPTALNARGVIIGSVRGAVNALPAFAEENGVRRELPLPAMATWGAPLGINARGQIVGFVSARANQTRHAALWDGKKVALLDDAGALSSEARAVNAGGEIVGFRLTADGGFHTVLWRQNSMEEIAALSRVQCHPTGINAHGEIVGVGIDKENRSHLYLWRSGGVIDLGRGYHAALNERGQIAGDCEASDHHFHACVWNDSARPVALPTLPDTNVSHALALNDRGQIVGYAVRESSTPDAANPVPVLWEKNRALDLNSLLPPGTPYHLEEAIAINNASQILCIARPKKGIWACAALLTLTGTGWQSRFF